VSAGLDDRVFIHRGEGIVVFRSTVTVCRPAPRPIQPVAHCVPAAISFGDKDLNLTAITGLLLVLTSRTNLSPPILPEGTMLRHCDDFTFIKILRYLIIYLFVEFTLT
jgi:hypothetical protein